MNQVCRVGLAQAVKRAHLDDGHRLVSMKQDRARVTIVGRDIGEPLHGAAEPIVGGLRDERVASMFIQDGARRRPSTLKFAVRDGRENARICDHFSDSPN